MSLENPIKPRMLYFQGAKREGLAPIIVEGCVDRIVFALAHHFDLVIIDDDCDYAEACERHQPEITLFELGLEGHGRTQPFRITNTHSHPHIPKTGLCRTDAFSFSRAKMYFDMERYQIETVFSFTIPFIEYFPGMEDNVIYWPQFANTDVYRDYGLPKVIPLLYVGSYERDVAQYAWRYKIKEAIGDRVPSLYYPHPGYGANSKTPITLFGRDYAHALNSALIVPACGSFTKGTVLKHFEIPACRSCLIAERSPLLEALGFTSMENCVFADENDIADKVDYLIRNRDVLYRIIENGHYFVHNRHSVRQRSQMLQWLRLHQRRQPGQKIVQPSLDGDLLLISENNTDSTFHIRTHGENIKSIQIADDLMKENKYAEAEHILVQQLRLVPYYSEPLLRAAVCNLYLGRPGRAVELINVSLGNYRHFYQAIEPELDADPVEWAYGIIAILCIGNIEQALRIARAYPLLSHPELDRARWAVFFLADRLEEYDALGLAHRPRRRTVHHLELRTFTEHQHMIATMLAAASQPELALRLANAVASGGEANIQQPVS